MRSLSEIHDREVFARASADQPPFLAGMAVLLSAPTVGFIEFVHVSLAGFSNDIHTCS